MPRSDHDIVPRSTIVEGVNLSSQVYPGWVLSRWKRWFGAVLVFVVTLAIMVATEPKLAIVWDEGFTLGREARVRLWLEALRDPSGFASRWVPPNPRSELVQQDQPPVPPLRRDEIDTVLRLLGPRPMAYFWPFAREEPHGHPPFYAIVGLLGDVFVPGWETLPRARFGPMLVFSLTSGALFGFVSGRWGIAPALMASGAWVLQPNLFGHGHYATLDGTLASLWVAALLAFTQAVEAGSRWSRWLGAIGFGTLCGWAADTKLTGWFLPIPFVAWALWDRNLRAARVLMIAGLVGVLVLFACNPSWWNDPVSGVERFFRSNLNRARSVPIEVMFLGRIYDTPRESLPWYNTVVWTVLVTPIGFLGFSLVGAVRSGVDLLRPWWSRLEARDAAPVDRFAVLVAMHWAFLLMLRAMPHTPGHDGVRLFLPAYGMLAILAGFGAFQVICLWGVWGRGLVAASLVEGVVSLAIMMPTPLAYYSPIVGGLPGASALGMEPTYFWDGLSDDAITFLNENSPRGRTVRFATFPTSWLYLKQTGKLKAPLWPIDRGEAKLYVLQNRPGAWSSFDRNLVENGKPAYQVSKLGVPILWVYSLP